MDIINGKIGKKYKVTSVYEEGVFKVGDIVIALENDSVPFCIAEAEYIEGKDWKEYALCDRVCRIKAMIIGREIIELEKSKMETTKMEVDSLKEYIEVLNRRNSGLIAKLSIKNREIHEETNKEKWPLNKLSIRAIAEMKKAERDRIEQTYLALEQAKEIRALRNQLKISWNENRVLEAKLEKIGAVMKEC